MSTFPNKPSSVKTKIGKLCGTQIPNSILLKLIIGFLSIVLILVGTVALRNVNSEEENIKKSNPQSEDCVKSSLEFREVLSINDLIVKEARIPEDCIYSPSLVTEYTETPFNLDYELRKKYVRQPKNYYSESKLQERVIEFGNVLFRQYSPEKTFYLTNIEILLDKELVLEDRINTITCSARQQTSYAMVDNSLYLAYYSGTVSEEDTYDGVEYHFYKVDNNGLTDLIATSNYSKVRDMFGMKGELLYFYEKSNELQGLNYGGEEILDGEYDYIENACCCQPAIWEISGNQKDKVSFFGKKENQWYKVIVETKKS